MQPTRRRRDVRLAVAVLAVLAVGVVAGCGPAGPEAGPTSDSPAPAASASPSDPGVPATATPAVPAANIPVASADLAATSADPVIAPVSLSIPAQSIAIPVDAVGVQADGQMEIPPLAERGGWYRFGASPGQETGTAVIAAHVDSIASAGLGPFARLENLAPGDAVEVTLADGTRRSFAVRTVDRVAKVDVRWQDVFVRDGDPRLVLITCGGVFQPAVGHYADNVIVTADPVGGS